MIGAVAEVCFPASEVEMPAELVSCPECQRKLRVPNDLIGKNVKCPTCGHTFIADPVNQAPPPPPPPEEKPTRTSKVSRNEKDDDDDGEDRSRRRRRSSRRDDDDDEDDRPRRRSRYSRDDDDDDDDDDDRPRRRRRGYLAPHRGGTILALGILSFFFVPIILGPMAWIMGNTDLAEMRAGRMDREGESQTNAGRVCGMISTILWIGGVVLFCMCAGFMGVAGGGHH
jgi:predicted Zn finger-like uncharacterized protein